MATEETAVAVVPTPMTMMDKLLSSQHTAEELRTLYELQRAWKHDLAVEAFNEAMHKVQREMPVVVCDCFNPQTKSKYPSLDNINRVAKPIYTKHDFSVMFGETDSKLENCRRWTLDIEHAGGHCKTIHFDLPTDGVGIKGNANMTAIHGVLSSNTYARSRLLVNGFNITVSEDGTDNDGNDSSQVITEAQANELDAMVQERYRPDSKELTAFMVWLEKAAGVTPPALSKIPAGKFEVIKKGLLSVSKLRGDLQ